jgi:hypothetical protein
MKLQIIVTYSVIGEYFFKFQKHELTMVAMFFIGTNNKSLYQSETPASSSTSSFVWIQLENGCCEQLFLIG